MCKTPHKHEQGTPCTSVRGGEQQCDTFPCAAAAGAAQPLRRAPNWLRQPAAATFGFGGKLVAVSNTRRAQQGGEAYDSRLVTISQVGIHFWV